MNRVSHSFRRLLFWRNVRRTSLNGAVCSSNSRGQVEEIRLAFPLYCTAEKKRERLTLIACDVMFRSNSNRIWPSVASCLTIACLTRFRVALAIAFAMRSSSPMFSAQLTLHNNNNCRVFNCAVCKTVCLLFTLEPDWQLCSLSLNAVSVYLETSL